MDYLILDIETVPLKIVHDDVKEYLMDKMISKEKRSLDPNYSRVIMVGLKVKDEPTRILKQDNEKQLLAEFWDFAKSRNRPIFVTHNGYQFDIPFIVIRSVVNGIEIPLEINTNKFRMEDSNHFDTMMFFSHYGSFVNPNLEVLGKLYGIEIPGSRIYGAEIEKLYRENRIDEIEAKCRRDIEMLEKVFTKLCLGYLLKKRGNLK